MSVLHLTLTKQWFDEILAGTKKVEYRKYNSFWCSRLTIVNFIHNGYVRDERIKQFNKVVFWNGGYCGGNLPMVAVECLGIEVQDQIETPLGKGNYFVISLGNILETKNIKK